MKVLKGSRGVATVSQIQLQTRKSRMVSARHVHEIPDVLVGKWVMPPSWLPVQLVARSNPAHRASKADPSGLAWAAIHEIVVV